MRKLERFVAIAMLGYSVLQLVGKFASIYMALMFDIPQGGGYDYALNKWMVSYADGFVRRGLTGQVLWHLHAWTGIEPQYILVPLCILLHMALVVFFVWKSVEIGARWWFVMMPLFLGGIEILAPDAFILGLVLASMIACRNLTCGVGRFAVLNLLGITAILVHEASFFFWVPFSLFLTLRDGRYSWRRTFILLPMLVAFLLAVAFPGNAESASRIIHAWKEALHGDFWRESPMKGIDSIGWTSRYVFMNAVHAYVTSRYFFVPAPIMLFGTILLAYYIVVGCFRTASQSEAMCRRLGGLLVFQFAAISPLLSCFYDTSRLLCWWMFSSLVAVIVFGKQIETTLPKVFFLIADRMNGAFEWGRGGGMRCIVCLALLMSFGVSPCGLSPERAAKRSVVGTYSLWLFRKPLESLGIVKPPRPDYPWWTELCM